MVDAILMPPAHGKSLFHQYWPCLREADKIADGKSTLELARLRSRAKETGDWAAFDVVLGKLLRERTSPGEVVMVCSPLLAEAAGFRIIGALVLKESEYEKNMRARGQHPDKHRKVYETVSALSYATYTTNKEMLAHIATLVKPAKREK